MSEALKPGLTSSCAPLEVDSPITKSRAFGRAGHNADVLGHECARQCRGMVIVSSAVLSFLRLNPLHNVDERLRGDLDEPARRLVEIDDHHDDDPHGGSHDDRGLA
jgi:hypothetical protein